MSLWRDELLDSKPVVTLAVAVEVHNSRLAARMVDTFAHRSWDERAAAAAWVDACSPQEWNLDIYGTSQDVR